MGRVRRWVRPVLAAAAVLVIGLVGGFVLRGTGHEEAGRPIAARLIGTDGRPVGEVLVSPFDLDGRFVSDALRERTIAYDARELRRIAVRIGVAGGPSKVRPILGALRGGTLTTLVTDEPTAEAVLALDATGAAP